MGLGSCDWQVADLVSEAWLWLLDPCSLCSVLSSHSLHWGSEPRGAAFLETALAPLSPDFYSVFFLFVCLFVFLISCRFWRTFQKYKNRTEWKGNTTCHFRIGHSGRNIVVSWLCFSERDTGETEDRVEVILLRDIYTDKGNLHL